MNLPQRCLTKEASTGFSVPTALERIMHTDLPRRDFVNLTNGGQVLLDF
ncbi:hypothetical protein GS682_09865 [Nostoc sp. B(2019)]|nr:hypothetical protein [Nostoc sp. B(2019)]